MNGPRPGPVGLLGLVAVGGALGAVARYGVGRAAPVHPGAFPWSTLAINLSGSLLLGLLVAWAGPRVRLRALLGTGVLGAYTTMSTFAVETDRLVSRGRAGLGPAVLYVGVSVAGGVAAAWAGLRAGERAWGRAR